MSGIVSSLMRVAHAPVYASRLRVLTGAITPHLRAGDRVLDVGCGSGTLGSALLAGPGCPEGVVVEGLERHVRGGEPIPVTAYEGGAFPFPDRSFDVVIVADVLHHDEAPEGLLSECRRVCRRYLIVKDHQIKGPLARARICLIDWAANAPYGVRCLFRYNTAAQWRAFPTHHGLRVVQEHNPMNLYPPVVNLVFGRSLQFMGVYEIDDRAGAAGGGA